MPRIAVLLIPLRLHDWDYTVFSLSFIFDKVKLDNYI